MYEAKFPEVEQVVMVQVKNIADMGAYVSLLEYNNIEGMILLSELSRRRIRSISSLIKVGRQEPVMVVRVDKQKGYIDLSKRRVSEEEVAACEEKYNKSKMVHSIMRHVAETSGVDVEVGTIARDLRCFFQILGAPLNTFPPLPSPSLVPLSPLLFLSSPPPTLSSPLPPPVVAVQELYTNVTWPLYRKYGHAFEAFKLVVTDPDAVLGGLTKEITETGEDGKESPSQPCTLTPTTPPPAVSPLQVKREVLVMPEDVKREVPAMPEDVKANLIANIRRRMTPQPLKIRADIELKCFHYDGVLHIKDAMRRAEQESEEDCAVRIVLVAPPLYVLTTFTLAKDKGIAVLERAIRAASEEIDKHKGKLTVKEAPRAVSDRDDRLLAEHMQKLTDANAEVDGDVDSEDEDEGMGSVDIDNAEVLRENKRMLDRSIRELDRERAQLQQQEKKLVADIKKSAKQGQMGAVRVMAKDLIRTRHQITKFYGLKSQLQGVSLRIQTLKSTQAMADAMKGVTKAMRSMNKQLNLPAMQKVMREFEMANERMEMTSEMMGDAIDDAMEGDEEEEETEELINEVLDEIGIDINQQLMNAPTPAAPQAQTTGKVAQADAVGAGGGGGGGGGGGMGRGGSSGGDGGSSGGGGGGGGMPSAPSAAPSVGGASDDSGIDSDLQARLDNLRRTLPPLPSPSRHPHCRARSLPSVADYKPQLHCCTGTPRDRSLTLLPVAHAHSVPAAHAHSVPAAHADSLPLPTLKICPSPTLTPFPSPSRNRVVALSQSLPSPARTPFPSPTLTPFPPRNPSVAHAHPRSSHMANSLSSHAAARAAHSLSVSFRRPRSLPPAATGPSVAHAHSLSSPTLTPPRCARSLPIRRPRSLLVRRTLSLPSVAHAYPPPVAFAHSLPSPFSLLIATLTPLLELESAHSAYKWQRFISMCSTIPHLTIPHLAIPHLAIPHLTIPHLAIPHLAMPHLAMPQLTIPHIPIPHIPILHLTIPHLPIPHLPIPHPISIFSYLLCTLPNPPLLTTSLLFPSILSSSLPIRPFPIRFSPPPLQVFPTPPSAQRHLLIPCAFLHQELLGVLWTDGGGQSHAAETGRGAACPPFPPSSQPLFLPSSLHPFITSSLPPHPIPPHPIPPHPILPHSVPPHPILPHPIPPAILLPIPFSSFPHPSFPHPIIPSASVRHPSISHAYFHHSTIQTFVLHHLLYPSPTHPLLSPSILSPLILSLSLFLPSILFQTHYFLIPSSPRPFLHVSHLPYLNSLCSSHPPCSFPPCHPFSSPPSSPPFCFSPPRPPYLPSIIPFPLQPFIPHFLICVILLHAFFLSTTVPSHLTSWCVFVQGCSASGCDVLAV
ncbi:unnamed protein product [Closterium sp. NIES-65]|nr:unnamed protein product [Closterium sp. NIES-65]